MKNNKTRCIFYGYRESKIEYLLDPKYPVKELYKGEFKIKNKLMTVYTEIFVNEHNDDFDLDEDELDDSNFKPIYTLDTWALTGDDNEWDRQEVFSTYTKINFCPICGRKLDYLEKGN